jgi:hypothetical protein
MTATAAQILALRRLTDEPLSTTYSDAQMQAFLEAHPLVDELGTIPYTWDISTDPPTKITTPQWIETWDASFAASEIWEEKAAALAELFNHSADGVNVSLSDKYDHAVSMAARCRSRRAIRHIPMTRGI